MKPESDISNRIPSPFVVEMAGSATSYPYYLILEQDATALSNAFSESLAPLLFLLWMPPILPVLATRLSSKALLVMET